MKKIAVLIPRGETMSSAVVAPYVIFTKANEFLQEQGAPPPFEIHLIGCEAEPAMEAGVFQVRTHCQLEEADGYDLAIAPGFTGDPQAALARNEPMVAWLREQRLAHGTELASLCTGAFYLAATGLAEGKKCTTHWAFAETFRRLFPGLRLEADQIVTDDGGIYTSGGAYSSLNLILYLLEKFCGKPLAIWAAKIFQIDLHRPSQRPFVIFNNQRSHADELIGQVQEHIESHYAAPLTINELAGQFGFSRRHLLRRFKEATGNTPIEYLQRVRIEAAKRLLEQSPKNVGEIVSATGYADAKTFRLLFKKYTGFSPMNYRNRYRH